MAIRPYQAYLPLEKELGVRGKSTVRLEYLRSRRPAIEFQPEVF